MKFCPRCGYAHPHCKCPDEPEPHAEGGVIKPPPGAIPIEDFQADPPSAAPAAAPTTGEAPPPGAIPVSEFESDEDKYGTTGQGIKAFTEGAAEGALGPLATAIETQALGVDPQEILNRRTERPFVHGAGQVAGFAGTMAAGVGLGRVAAGAGELAAGAAGLGALGSAAVRTGAELASLQASDELTRMMIHDPNQSLETAVADVGLSGVLGAGAGALFKGAGIAAGKLTKEDTFLGDFLGRLKARMGIEVAPPEAEAAVQGVDFRKPVEAPPVPEGPPMPVTPGEKAADAVWRYGLNRIGGEAMGATIGGSVGHATGIPGMGALGSILGKQALGPFLETVIPAISKPILENVVNGAGMKAAAEYGLSVLSGTKLIQNAAKAVLGLQSSNAVSAFEPSQKEIDKLDTQLKEYAQDPSKLIQIGAQLGHYMPGHASALGETAQRAVNYLNEQRPKEATGLAFDNPRKPTDVEMRDWNRTLSIAQQPLVTFKYLQSNRLNFKDLKTLSTLYPALYGSMKTQIMNSIIDAKTKGTRVPYNRRLQLSLFLGQPLDSTMTPQALQSFQTTFATPSQQSNAQTSAGKRQPGQKLTKIAGLSLTPEQARERETQTKG